MMEKLQVITILISARTTCLDVVVCRQSMEDKLVLATVADVVCTVGVETVLFGAHENDLFVAKIWFWAWFKWTSNTFCTNSTWLSFVLPHLCRTPTSVMLHIWGDVWWWFVWLVILCYPKQKHLPFVQGMEDGRSVSIEEEVKIPELY